MGLFDFLKKKPADSPTAPTPAATPGTSVAEQAAEAARSGPRYKRPNYVAPVEAAAPLMPPPPPMPPMPVPPMPEFVPTNALEEALLRAGSEAEFRPIFYRELLDHELLLLPLPVPGRDTGEVTIEPGTEVQLQMLNDNKLPVFSSLERVFEGGIVPEGMPYLRMRGFDFFNMVRGAECVLNPFSPVGKLLTAQELDDLLAGNLLPADAALEPAPGAPEARIQLSQPAEYPTELAEVVRTFSAQHPQIREVYLAEMQLENTPEQPRLLLGFALETEDGTFLQELGPHLEPVLRGSNPIDLMVLSPDPNDPLAAYLRQTEAVYLKA